MPPCDSKACAEAGELGEVVDGAAGGSELEVDQRNGDAVTEDDVRKLHVVVAHERAARRVSQSLVPSETLRVEPAGGVVQSAQQPSDGRQRGVGLAPARIGRKGTSPSMNTRRSRPSLSMPTGNEAPLKPVCLNAHRKAWIEPECGFEGRRTCGPTRTSWPTFAIPPASCCSATRPL